MSFFTKITQIFRTATYSLRRQKVKRKIVTNTRTRRVSSQGLFSIRMIISHHFSLINHGFLERGISVAFTHFALNSCAAADCKYS